MKLKNLYLFFIIFSSFYTKAQSIEINKPVLANSESLLNDSLKNKRQENLPQLSMQDSKTDNKEEHVAREAKLIVSEALKTEETKDVIIQPKK
jgi:hypothetical protein